MTHFEIVVKHSDSTLRFVPAVLFLALGMASAQAPSPESVMNRRVPRALDAGDQSQLYAAHGVLLEAGLSGGVVDLGDVGPTADAAVPEGTTVSEALTQVLGGRTKYYWREIGGGVDILPQKGIPPLLVTNIPFYEWRSDESPYSAVERLQQLPEVTRRMSQLGYVDGLHHGPGLQKAPRVAASPEPLQPPRTYVRRNMALLDLLNEIVKSYPPPAIWSYQEVVQDQVRAVTISAR